MSSTMNNDSDNQKLSFEENKFYHDIKQLLDDITIAESKTAKMIISTEIYIKINDNLETILHRTPVRWTQFAATVYNKTTQFEEQRKTNCYDDINQSIVETHTKEYMKARKFIASFLKDVNKTIINNNHVAEALANLKKEEEEDVAKKPQRNIPEKKQVSIMKLRGREIVRMI